MTAITESLGQKFYKLDNERREYIRADVHLIRKGPGKKPQENFDEDEANADVEARRKINLDEEERTEEIDPEEEQKQLKRMNKTDRAKYLAKREPKKGPDLSGALGGRASGSGMFETYLKRFSSILLRCDCWNFFQGPARFGRCLPRWGGRLFPSI